MVRSAINRCGSPLPVNMGFDTAISDQIQGRALGLPIYEIRIRDPLLQRILRIHGPKPNQSIAVGIGKGTEQYGIHDTEDRRAGADPKRERYDG